MLLACLQSDNLTIKDKNGISKCPYFYQKMYLFCLFCLL